MIDTSVHVYSIHRTCLMTSLPKLNLHVDFAHMLENLNEIDVKKATSSVMHSATPLQQGANVSAVQFDKNKGGRIRKQ